MADQQELLAAQVLWVDLGPAEAPDELEWASSTLCAKELLRTHGGRLALELHGAIQHSAHADDPPPPPRRHVALALHALLCWRFPLEYPGPLGHGDLLAKLFDRPPPLPIEAPQLYYQLEQCARKGPARPSIPLQTLPALRPTLRPYQQEAVEWMLGRERVESASSSARAQGESLWTALWQKLTLPRAPTDACGEEGASVDVYWNAFSGALLPPGEMPPPDDDVRGGILADEMGLGKSVEIIALLLAHRRPQECAPIRPASGGPHELTETVENTDQEEERGCFCGCKPRFADDLLVQCDACCRWVHGPCAGFATEDEAEAIDSYICLICASERGERSPVPCNATLLVCPAAILSQWREEVQRHVGTRFSDDNEDGRLRVCTYTGLKSALAGASRDPAGLAACHPAALAKCDLVLTTFEALRGEFNHTNAAAPCTKAFDRPQRGRASYGRSRSYDARALRSPLLSFVWWRLVIDEAQMVESSTAKSAAMVRLLHATNRWAVSGTPLGRGFVSDLHGLFAFLGVSPWSESAWWTHAILYPLNEAVAAEQDAAITHMLSRLPGLRRVDITSATNGAGLSRAQLCDEVLISRVRHWLTMSAPNVKAACAKARLCVSGSKGTLALRLALRALPETIPLALSGGPTTMPGYQVETTITEAQIGDRSAPGRGKNQQESRWGTGSAIPNGGAYSNHHERTAPHEPSNQDNAVGLSDLPEGHRRSAEALCAHDLVLRLCHRYMWRNSKRSVEAQIGLPPQREFIHSIHFSSIETHFYRKQMEAVEARARAAFAQRDSGGSTDGALEKLAGPLLRLRQACCHPQLGTYGLGSRGEGGRRGRRKRRRSDTSAEVAPSDALMTMSAVHERLIELERTSCEDAMRETLFYAFGLAGMALCDGLYTLAASWYADAYSLCYETRRPTLLPSTISAVLVGPNSEAAGCERVTELTGCRFTTRATSYRASDPIGPLVWHFGGGESAARLVAGAPTGQGELGISDPIPVADDINVWFRIDLSKPKRLSRLVIQLGEAGQIFPLVQTSCDVPAVSPTRPGSPRQPRLLWPRHCVLSANCIDGQATVVVDVAHLELRPEAMEMQEFDFYRPTKSKHWTLTVKSFWRAPSDPDGEDDVVACALHRIKLHEAEVEVDSTHLLHMTHNLAGALRGRDAEIGATLNFRSKSSELSHTADELSTLKASFGPMQGDIDLGLLNAAQIAEQSDGLRAQLVGERTAVHRNAKLKLSESRNSTAEAEALVSSPHWLHLAFSVACGSGLEESLRERLRTDESIPDSARSQCRNWESLLRWVEAETQERSAHRTDLLQGLDALTVTPSRAELQENSECGNCRSDWGKTGPRCAHCKLEAKYNQMELKLFSYRRSRVVELVPAPIGDAGATAANRGEAFRIDAPLIALLKTITRWIGAQVSSGTTRLAECYKHAEADLRYIACLQRELKYSHEMWMAHFDLLSQLDELTMATRTVTILEDPHVFERIPLNERSLYVPRHVVEERKTTDSVSYNESRRKLAHARSQLKFLRSIADGSGAAEPHCPVCFSAWADERMIATCGHSICFKCSEKMMAVRNGVYVCPICTRRGTLALATEMQVDDGSAAGTKVHGSWGTKVTAIVEQVLALPDDDKCLIFSQWENMLDIIMAAFNMNEIPAVRLGPQGKLDAALDLFKRDKQVRVLLMPLARGANGINLTAAQHVMFVEPLLNPAVEAQAIGRVHRISQTKPTTIHRFAVADSIEVALLALRHRGASARTTEAADDASLSASPRKAGAATMAEESHTLTWDELEHLFPRTDPIDVVETVDDEPRGNLDAAV